MNQLKALALVLVFVMYFSINIYLSSSQIYLKCFLLFQNEREMRSNRLRSKSKLTMLVLRSILRTNIDRNNDIVRGFKGTLKFMKQDWLSPVYSGPLEYIC